HLAAARDVPQSRRGAAGEGPAVGRERQIADRRVNPADRPARRRVPQDHLLRPAPARGEDHALPRISEGRPRPRAAPQRHPPPPLCPPRLPSHKPPPRPPPRGEAGVFPKGKNATAKTKGVGP